ncbi:MAG: shikimate dehydrogenase family protein [Hyphomicrobiaceae bacterium]
MTDPIRLGLIGDNIAKSQAPRLHRLAGMQSGRHVTYERLVPAELGLGFDDLFATVATSGYRGVNITYPYKERAAAKVIVRDPLVRAMGAVNTVIFEDGNAYGFNTDYSGFIAAYRRQRGEAPVGAVLLIGAGGVGKAVAFGLIALGLTDLRIVDLEAEKAHALADALRSIRPEVAISCGSDAVLMAENAEGIVNCTPVGMVGHDGTPIERSAMGNAGWAFDAVYTPVETQFLADASAQGLEIISGYELFFGQGVGAWQIFTGLPLDEARLRRDLASTLDVG